MKKVFLLLLLALTSWSMLAQTNLAEGKTSIASSGTASQGNDGNLGTRWESEHGKDPQRWQVDLGEPLTFNTIQIVWEGAYGKSFTIVAGDNVGDDGYITGGVTIATVTDQSLSAFPHTQTLRLDGDKKYRYVEFVGTARGTGYGYSFWEFRVFEASAQSTLTTLSYAPATPGKNDASLGLAAVGSAVPMTLTALDQDGLEYDTSGAKFTVTGAGGTVSADGKTFTPSAKGLSVIAATLGDKTDTARIYAYEGLNLAQGKLSAKSGEADGLTATMAFDENEGTRWASGTPVSSEAPAYVIADLAAYYDIDAMELYFENANPAAFTIEFSKDGKVWATGESVSGLSGFQGGRYYYYAPASNSQVRYVKFNSTSPATDYGVSIIEFRVYGSGKTPIADSNAPADFTATLGALTPLSAIVNLKASDDVASSITYHVVDGSHGIDVTASGASGAVVLQTLQLEPTTAYSLGITASDGVNVTDTVKLNVTTPSMPSVPTPAATSYVAIYGSALGTAEGYGWYSWGGSDNSGKAIDINGDEAFVIRNFTYYGSQFGTVDVSTQDTLHFDVYATANARLTVVPINSAATGGNQPEKGFECNLVAGEWNNISLPIDSIIARGTDMKSLYQIKYVSTIAHVADADASDGFANGDGTLTFVVGNIYAFKKPGEPTAVADVNVSNAVTSVVYYNAAGQQASTPFHGFNIVVSSRADGTKTVSKTLK